MSRQRRGKTPRQSVRLAASRLEKTAGGPFGVVLNAFDADGEGSRYGRYHAYYGRYESPETEGDKPADVDAGTRAGGRGA